MKEYRLLIDGEWKESGQVRDIQSPFDRSSAGKVHWAERSQVEEALAAAERAFVETRKLSGYERSQALAKISQGIKNRKEELAR